MTHMARDQVVSPGIAAAVRAWLAANHKSQGWFARNAGLSDATLYNALSGKRHISAIHYDRIAAIIPEPWTRHYCEIAERPPYPVRETHEQEQERDYAYKRIKTPHLDEFAGIVGGWI